MQEDYSVLAIWRLRQRKIHWLPLQIESFRAHEFHYWNSDCPGEDYEIKKASDNSIASAGYGSDTLYAGFPHIYFYGNEQVQIIS